MDLDIVRAEGKQLVQVLGCAAGIDYLNEGANRLSLPEPYYRGHVVGRIEAGECDGTAVLPSLDSTRLFPCFHDPPLLDYLFT